MSRRIKIVLVTSGLGCGAGEGGLPDTSVQASLGNPIVVTDAGTGTVSTDSLFVKAMSWTAAGTAGSTLIVRDQFDTDIWSQVSIADQTNFTIRFTPYFTLDGLKVPQMDSGSFFLYLE